MLRPVYRPGVGLVQPQTWHNRRVRLPNLNLYGPWVSPLCVSLFSSRSPLSRCLSLFDFFLSIFLSHRLSFLSSSFALCFNSRH